LKNDHIEAINDRRLKHGLGTHTGVKRT